jgi:D-alanyl-D-alanine-carboxypeptidase/D-alanyl-D-alanine-endopeptidase
MRFAWSLLLFAACTAAFAQDSPLQALIATRIEEDLSGACVAVARVAPASAGGHAVDAATRCAGSARSLPARPGYRFEIGSITKGFTGVLLAEMIERGEVTLDDPLQKFLPPGAAAPHFDSRQITLRDLVTHTSELPSLPPRLRPRQMSNPSAEADSDVVHGSLADIRLSRAPGVRYRYSNWGFMLLSDALGRRAGKPYDELLRERVLAPLGMSETLVGDNSGLLPGHTASGRRTPPWDIPAPYGGAGAIRSTPADMAEFARALLGDVPPETPETLRRALDIAQRKLHEANRNVAVAMGWHLIRQGDREYIAHNGGTGGFSSAFVIDPQDRIAAIVLADTAGGFDDLAFRMVNPGAPLATPRRAVALDVATAQAIVGRYELRPEFMLEITLVDGRLYSQVTGQPRFELLQDSHGDYYPTEFDALLRFTREGEGKASGVSLFQGGGLVRGRRADG